MIAALVTLLVMFSGLVTVVDQYVLRRPGRIPLLALGLLAVGRVPANHRIDLLEYHES
jgi:hypothetical protein